MLESNLDMKKSVLLFCWVVCTLNFGCKQSNKLKESSRNVLHYAATKPIYSLDPAFAMNETECLAVKQLYNGLVQLNDSLEVEPAIAKSWTIADDGLTYTFTLRNDVYFHDHILFLNSKGRKVRSADFVNSFTRICNPAVASPGAWIFNELDKSAISNYKGVTEKNDTTLVIHLRRPFSPFLKLLCLTYCSVVPIEVADYYGNAFRLNPVGTGAFQKKYWKEGEQLILSKNQNYFETNVLLKLPLLDAISFDFTIDPSSTFTHFLEGKLDFVSGIDDRFSSKLIKSDGCLAKEYESKFKLYQPPHLVSNYLGFNSKINSLLNNAKGKLVRKAIQYAINKKKLIQNLNSPTATVASNGIVPDALKFPNNTSFIAPDYNREKAKILMQRAGYTESNPFPLLKIIVEKDAIKWCSLIQNDLLEIGIRTELVPVEDAVLDEMIRHADLSMYARNEQPLYADPMSYFDGYFLNHSGYTAAAELDSDLTESKLYHNLFTEQNEEMRKKMVQQLDQQLIEEGWVVPIFYASTPLLSQRGIQGLKCSTLSNLQFKSVKKE